MSSVPTVGDNIARLRRAVGISQKQLAEIMREAGFPWHQNTVSRVENDRQTLTDYSEVEALSQALGGSNIFTGTNLARMTGGIEADLEDPTALDRSVPTWRLTVALRGLDEARLHLAQADKCLDLAQQQVATHIRSGRDA